jgi:hypothetical protein
MGGKLEPIYVPADDVDLYGVELEGWYSMDEDFVVIEGPYVSRNDCLRDIMENPKAA